MLPTQSTSPEPLTSEYVCPGCGTRYDKPIPACGQNLPVVCRERPVARVALTPAAIERMCKAYDDDWYEGKDHTPEGEATWDLMEQLGHAIFDWPRGGRS